MISLYCQTCGSLSIIMGFTVETTHTILLHVHCPVCNESGEMPLDLYEFWGDEDMPGQYL